MHKLDHVRKMTAKTDIPLEFKDTHLTYFGHTHSNIQQIFPSAI